MTTMDVLKNEDDELRKRIERARKFGIDDKELEKIKREERAKKFGTGKFKESSDKEKTKSI